MNQSEIDKAGFYKMTMCEIGAIERCILKTNAILEAVTTLHYTSICVGKIVVDKMTCGKIGTSKFDLSKGGI